MLIPFLEVFWLTILSADRLYHLHSGDNTSLTPCLFRHIHFNFRGCSVWINPITSESSSFLHANNDGSKRLLQSFFFLLSILASLYNAELGIV